MVEKYLYKVQVPKKELFFKDSFLKKINHLEKMNRINESFHEKISPADVINDEFLNFNNLNFTGAIIFAPMTNSTQMIHCDYILTKPIPKSVPVLNWQFVDDGKINFWEMSQCKIDNANFKWNLQENEKLTDLEVPSYIALSAPCQTYELLNNDVYLINAAMPHQVQSHGNRVCLSVRMADLKSNSWAENLKIFNNIIN